jgi:hypothetical protein
MPSPLTDYDPEWETFEPEASEWSGAAGYEVLGETAEIELATELLAVRDEQELDQFLDNLIRQVGRTVGSIAGSPLAQTLPRGLKGLLKQTLPLAGGALGTLAGGPLGASIGSGLASMAGRALGLELEGLSREDQELEAAKRFIRLAGDAVRNAGQASSVKHPATVAQAAIAAAARRFAPGLLRLATPTLAGAGRNGGQHPQWQRDPRSAASIYTRPAEDTMHDIDRTQLETDPEMETYEYQQFEWPGETEAVFSEAEEMELASQLMEVRDEQELDQFLSAVIRGAGRALGGFVRSPEGQAIGGILKGALRQILPHAAGALGTIVGGPLGAQISSSLASVAGNEVGMESESWNQEEREYEGAKQFVRVAADTVRNTLAAGPEAEPVAAAQAAISQAAQMLAPGLLQSAPRYDVGRRGGGDGYSGRWKRRGRKIVLYGV